MIQSRFVAARWTDSRNLDTIALLAHQAEINRRCETGIQRVGIG